jgi:hypothetical protein
MMQCQMCGVEGKFGHLRAMYSCQAPHCPRRNVTMCVTCLVQKLGAPSDALGQPTTCPTCGVGVLKSLGTH